MSDAKTNESEVIETPLADLDSTTTAYGYEIKTFEDGNILTAADLNRMQDNINTVFAKVEAIVGNTDSTEAGTLLDKVNQLAESSAVSDLSARVDTLEDFVGADGNESDETLAAKVNKLENQLKESTEGEQNTIADRVKSAETNINDLDYSVGTLEKQIEKLDDKVGPLESQLKESEEGTTLVDKVNRHDAQLTKSENGKDNTIADRVAALESPGRFIKNRTDTNGWEAPIVYGNTSLGTQTLQPGQIYLEYVE